MFVNIKIRFAVGLLAGIVFLFLLHATRERETFSFEIPNQQTIANGGFCYTYTINYKPWLWPLLTYNRIECLFEKTHSFFLYENNVQLGPETSSHDEIRIRGGGRHSFWGNTLYFSSLNGSDLRKSVDHFTIQIKPGISVIGVFFIIACLAVSVWSVGFIKPMIYTQKILAKWLDKNKRISTVLIAILFSLYFITILHQNWSSGKSANLALASYYQISDASAYWFGAQELLRALNDHEHYASPILEWCQRRCVYPTFLAGLFVLGGGDIYKVLILQVIFCSLSFALLVMACRFVFNWFCCCIIVLITAGYFSENILCMTMSENAGFIFGTTGVAFLVNYSAKQRLIFLFTGLFFFSLGLSSRSGAVFVLPLLLAWSVYVYYQSNKRYFILAILISIFSCASGPVIQRVLNYQVTGTGGVGYGNFSYVLYGLASGGKGWSYVLHEHSELLQGKNDLEMNLEIYKLAFEKIRNEPEGLFRGFAKNLGNILASGPSGIFLGPFRSILFIMYTMGFLYCLVSIKDSFSALMVASTVGIFLSSIVILEDGGQRLFAATIAFDAMLVGLGVKCIINAFNITSKIIFGRTKILSVISNEDNESLALLQHIMGGIQITPLLIPFCSFLVSEPRLPELIQTNNSSLAIKTDLDEPGILICGLGSAPSNSPPLYSIARLQQLLPYNGIWWRDDIALNNGKILVSLPCRVSIGTDHKLSCIQFIADIGMQISTRDKQYITLKKTTDSVFGVKYYIAE